MMNGVIFASNQAISERETDSFSWEFDSIFPINWENPMGTRVPMWNIPWIFWIFRDFHRDMPVKLTIHVLEPILLLNPNKYGYE